MGCLENMIIYCAVFIVLVSMHAIKANEDEHKPVVFFYPVVTTNNGIDPRILNAEHWLVDQMLGNQKELDTKRGPPIHTLTPTPRRRSDPDFLKWENEINNAIDDDYEGPEYGGSDLKRPYFGFPRISRSGSARFYSKLGEGSQETIKRGGPGGGAGMWFGPRLGRVQKRSQTQEHV